MANFEKVTATGSVPHAERMQSVKRENSTLAQPAEAWQKRSATSFSKIRRHLDFLHEGLKESQVQRERREKEAYAAITRFGRAFTEFSSAEMSGTFKDQAKDLFRSEDTLFRWRTGQSIPSHHEITDVLSKIEKITGRRIPAERQAILLDAHKEASEVPRTLRKKLAVARAEFAESIKRNAGLADRLNVLQKEIDSLERQLSAAQASSGFNSQDALKSGQIFDRREEEELRRRLVRAQQDLKETLKQQEENQQELRERAQELVEAIDSYLTLTRAFMSE